MIRPGFWTDAAMLRLPVPCRLLYIGIWTVADHWGQLPDDALEVKASVYPNDFTEAQVRKWIDMLVDAGRMVRAVDSESGRAYLVIPKWRQHQSIHKNLLATQNWCVNPENLKANGNATVTLPPVADGPTPKVDQIRSDQTRPEDEAPAGPAPARLVFDHWVKAMGKSANTKFLPTTQRYKKVLARFKDGFSVDQLCRAVDGCKLTPHNMGQNDRQALFNDLELICRTVENVERFIEATAGPAPGAAALKPPEQRRIEEQEVRESEADPYAEPTDEEIAAGKAQMAKIYEMAGGKPGAGYVAKKPGTAEAESRERQKRELEEWERTQ